MTKSISETNYPKKTKPRVSLQSTRKLGCKATVHIRCVEAFTDFFLGPSKYKSKREYKQSRAKTMRKVQDLLLENPNHGYHTERRYYVRVPLCSVHREHSVGKFSSIGHYADKRVTNSMTW